MTYIKINDMLYPAFISGRISDKDWDGRESKSISLDMTYEEAINTFTDDVEWFIIYQQDENTEPETYDNSEFSIAGPVTDNRDGTVTVKMGKPTAEELLAILEGEIG